MFLGVTSRPGSCPVSSFSASATCICVTPHENLFCCFKNMVRFTVINEDYQLKQNWTTNRKFWFRYNRMIPFYIMHNRIYRLAKIEFASFVDASLSRGSLHIFRRPLKFDVPILVYENSREPTAHAWRSHIRFCKRYSSNKQHLFLVNSTLSGL
jgi:hypothetical protein